MKWSLQKSILLLIGIFYLTLFLLAFHYKSQIDSIYDDDTAIRENWILKTPNEEKAITLPYPYSAKEPEAFEISHIFTEEAVKQQDELYVSSYFCDMEVYLDEELFYSYVCEKSPTSKTKGCTYFFLKMPGNLTGKTLTIKYIPQVKIENFSIDAPIYGNKGDIFIQILSRQFLDTILILILVMAGVWLVGGSILKRLFSHQSSGTLLPLGLFALLSGMYLGVCLRWIRILAANSYMIYLTEYLLQLILILPVLYLLQGVLYGKSKKLMTILIYINLLSSTIQYLLHFLTGMELREMLVESHAVLIYSVCTCIYCIFLRKEITNEFYREISYAIIPVGLGGILAVGLHYVRITEYTGTLLEAGILAFVAIDAYYDIRRYRRHSIAQQKDSIYREIAYKDIFTGLRNRNAYELELNRLEEEKEKYSYIAGIVFDLNGLKKINDTMGHDMGDKLIKSMAEALSHAFYDSRGIFRTGGDEFVVLLAGESVKSIEKMKKSLEREKKYCIKENGLLLDFSCGIAVYDKKIHENIRELLREADNRMYESKRKYHDQRKEV